MNIITSKCEHEEHLSLQTTEQHTIVWQHCVLLVKNSGKQLLFATVEDECLCLTMPAKEIFLLEFSWNIHVWDGCWQLIEVMLWMQAAWFLNDLVNHIVPSQIFLTDLCL